MAATAAAKQNTTKGRGLYFIGINRRFCTPSFGLTPSSLFQSAYVAVPSKTDEFGNTVNIRTRNDMKEQLGISPATASRNNNRLKIVGIEKQGINTYVCQNDASEGEPLKKWYCPTEILTETFSAEDDDGNKILITFTYCDALVYSYYYTLLPHTGRNTRTIEAAFEEIADALGIDSSTVSDAVKKLRIAGLIYFPCGWTGKNRYKKSKVGLRRGFSWFKREQEYRALLNAKKESKDTSEQKETTPPKAPKNATVAREKYYGGLQSDAERKAAQALSEVLKNNDFKKLHKELSEIQYEYNNAIIRNDASKQKKLSLKISELNKKRTAVLKNIGIAPEELETEYYIKCKDCKDTGEKTDGTACDCWKKKRQRGSPPRSGKKISVGEQNTKN